MVASSWQVCLSAIAACVIMTMSAAVVMFCEDGASLGAPVVSNMALEDGSRTVTYEWYDFFDVPFGDWWDKRWEAYGIDLPCTDSYPFLHRRFTDSTSFDTLSGARLNITGRDMPELNMTDNPEFLPFLSGEYGPRGGNATIDWYMQYATVDDLLAYNPLFETFNDGFLVILNGTVRLDLDAAMAVMGITSDGFDDLDAWWAGNGVQFVNDYIDWILYEGNERLDIFPMYEYPLSPLIFNIDAENAGDEIVLTYETVSWGMEAMMTRWMHESFMSTEWWFEDMTFHAEIGPEEADLDIDTGVECALKAWETKDSGTPCWIWQGMLQDCIISTLPHPLSDYDIYDPLTYISHSPGSPCNGLMVDYRYVPGSFDLSEGETLSFVWPDGDLMFLKHVGPWVTDNTSAPGRVKYSEPMPAEMSGSAALDPDDRTLTYVGPMDFLAWSQEQDDHENLSAEWDRLGVLPWGMPYFEISLESYNAPPFAYLTAEHYPGANTSALFLLDASGSSDAEDLSEELEYRWDMGGAGGWDTEWGGESLVVYDFGEVGEYNVVVEVRDMDGASDVSDVVVSITDVAPPVTTASIKGIGGSNGWFVSDVLLNLTSDDEGGVESTTYRLDGDDWTVYLAEVEVATEGSHVVAYCSVDCEGNYEAVCETEFKLDKTAPVASFVTDTTVHITSNVTIVWSRSDAVSGVNRSELSLDGQRYISFGSAMLNTFVGMTDGSHVIELRVYDNAGNYASDTYMFTVTLSEDPDDAPVTPRDDDSPAIYLAGALGAVAAIAIAAILIQRRKS